MKVGKELNSKIWYDPEFKVIIATQDVNTVPWLKLSTYFQLTGDFVSDRIQDALFLYLGLRE